MTRTANHYEALGLSPSATEEEVRRAHRRMVMRYHPDRNDDPAAGLRFQEVQEAYRVLSDPARRARLDAELGAAASAAARDAGESAGGGYRSPAAGDAAAGSRE